MRILLLLMAATISGQALAKDMAQGDTTVIDNPKRVTIITNDSLQSVYVEGMNGQPDFKCSYTMRLGDGNFTNEMALNDETWLFSIGGMKKKTAKLPRYETAMTFAAGFCDVSGLPNRATISPFKSWELWWIIADWRYRPHRDRHVFSYGIGLDWRNYRMTDEQRFVKRDGQVVIENYPEGAAPKFSRIKVFSITIPIRYHYSDGKHLGFSVGPVINLNTYSSIKTHYRQDGKKHKDVDKNLKINPFTVDFMATINLPHSPDIYFKYCPFNLIKDGHGPKFKTLSFGLMF